MTINPRAILVAIWILVFIRAEIFGDSPGVRLNISTKGGLVGNHAPRDKHLKAEGEGNKRPLELRELKEEYEWLAGPYLKGLATFLPDLEKAKEKIGNDLKSNPLIFLARVLELERFRIADEIKEISKIDLDNLDVEQAKAKRAEVVKAIIDLQKTTLIHAYAEKLIASIKENPATAPNNLKIKAAALLAMDLSAELKKMMPIFLLAQADWALAFPKEDMKDQNSGYQRFHSAYGSLSRNAWNDNAAEKEKMVVMTKVLSELTSDQLDRILRNKRRYGSKTDKDWDRIWGALGPKLEANK